MVGPQKLPQIYGKGNLKNPFLLNRRYVIPNKFNNLWNTLYQLYGFQDYQAYQAPSSKTHLTTLVSGGPFFIHIYYGLFLRGKWSLN